ncbi:MAG: response regulator transcription factor [Chloroflexota bacterium]|nr:response regulator transcription factor [Chloroflexota bacterium]
MNNSQTNDATPPQSNPSMPSRLTPGKLMPIKLTPIKLMIVEDHPLLIQGLRRVVDEEADIEIVAEVTDGDEALKRALELEPDVILMDINLPGKNGLQVTREIKNNQMYDDINIIILTAYNDDEQLLHALRAGAAAYYPKDVRPSELIPAIRAVASGKYVINNKFMGKPDAFRWIIERLEENSNGSDPVQEMYQPLSPREMEILIFITQGASNKEIAYALGISRQTVKNHMSSVLRKIGVEDRTQAAVLALRRGWVRLEDTYKVVDGRQ